MSFLYTAYITKNLNEEVAFLCSENTINPFITAAIE